MAEVKHYRQESMDTDKAINDKTQKAICPICPHRCALNEGQHGLCRARVAKDGIVIAENYGKITAINLDPIEKKPLAFFHPGSYVLSVGSYGCNLRCPFCQNHEISQASLSRVPVDQSSPQELTDLAINLKPRGNIGLAFTYNEPLVGYEFVKDTCALAKQAELSTVVVTNGMINPEPLMALLPFIDAMNIDLKGFTQSFYERCGGYLQTVKDTIKASASRCHVEVTCLVVPGMNDSLEEIDNLSSWLASVNPDIILHLSRFFPRFKMTNAPPTDINLLRQMKEIASSHLKHVLLGNV